MIMRFTIENDFTKLYEDDPLKIEGMIENVIESVHQVLGDEYEVDRVEEESGDERTITLVIRKKDAGPSP